MRFSLLFAVACGALLLTAQAPASGKKSAGVIARHPFPSPNSDEFVFEADFEGTDQLNLWISSIGGTSLRKLATGCVGAATTPTWSPDGRAIAFVCRQEIVLIRPDGSHLRQLGHGMDATWSPDSERIAFVDGGDIWVMNADGTDRQLVISAAGLTRAHRPHVRPLSCAHPSFSPTGAEIVFSLNDPGGSASLMTVDEEGSNLHALTDGRYQDWNPLWSTFGILFSSNRDSSGHFKAWLVQPDGRGLHRLSNAPALDPVFLSTGLVIFGDETAPTPGSRIAVLDPHTGIKHYVTAGDRSESLRSPVPPNAYIACGCGCCGGEPINDQCLYHTHGQSFVEIRKSDQALKNSAACELVGCSKGVRYHYCD